METTSPRLVRWDDLPWEMVTDMLSRRIVTGEKVMAAHIHLKKGCVVPRHSHEAEQFSYTFSGALKFVIAGETFVARPGQLLIIPAWEPHEAVALEDTHEMDVFSPIRYDWLSKTDSYFKGPATQPADLNNPATSANPARLVNWSEQPVERISEQIDRVYQSGANITFCDFTLRKGAVVPAHHHESEQLTWVRGGRLRFTIADETVDVAAGTTILIPSNVPHSAVALEDTKAIDLFSPRREDWIAKTDHYLRQGNR
ncbi:MAG: cupin domain-containing protein [Gemmatimonadetes bacterium]|nr:cupin domain-containing protein [Gemmatimonadota bacterium]